MELNSRPTMCLLSAKQSIENWNVRSMFQTGETAIAAAEMRRYNLADFDIYGGDFRQGVVFMLSKDAFNTLLELTEVNERMVEAKFESKHGVFTIIQCYTPTNGAEETRKNNL